MEDIRGNRFQFDEKQIDLEDLEEILGVKGVHPEDMPILANIAAGWMFQAEIGGLNKRTINSITHGLRVRATALMPSLSLKQRDPELFERFFRQSQLTRAEEAIVNWAFKEENTIEGVARLVVSELESVNL